MRCRIEEPIRSVNDVIGVANTHSSGFGAWLGTTAATC
jgi:hypothetical protein